MVAQGSLGVGATLGHWLGGACASESSLTPHSPDINSPERQTFDCILANLPGRIQIALAADFQQALSPSGLLLTSGYTQDYEPDIQAAFAEHDLRPVARLQTQEWVALASQSRRVRD